MRRKLVFFTVFIEFLICFISLNCFSQNLSVLKISANFQNTPLASVLENLEQNYPLKFYYQSSWLEGVFINEFFSQSPLNQVLEKILKPAELSYISPYPSMIILVKSQISIQKDTSETLNTHKGKAVIVIDDPSAEKSDRLTVSGYVKDGQSGESLVGATVFIPELNQAGTTNAFGFYSLSVAPGQYTLRVNYVAYQEESYTILLKSSGTLDVELFDAVKTLEEVTVTGEAEDQNVSGVLMGINRLTINTIEKIPPFAGEVDVIKSLVLLPGVKTIGENSSGFFVRGGSADQNLILQDEGLIFNPNHLFGFFSTYNPDIVKDVTLYKGSIPAQYGGRLSSVLDVKLKEGNSKKIVGQGGIGLITSRLSLEGPLIKEKSTFVIAGRISYNDWILKLLNNIELRRSSAFFYDANFKLVHRLNENNKISLSAYTSQDNFKLASDTSYSWKNLNVAIQWNRIFSKKLFSNFTYVFGLYDSDISSFQGAGSFKLNSGINYHKIEADFGYFGWEKHQLDFGFSSIYYQLRPGERNPTGSDSGVQEVKFQNQLGLESGLYIGDEIKLNDRITMMIGLRYSLFHQFGADSVFVYQDGAPKSRFTIQDTLFYNSGQVVQYYGGLEPRFSFQYRINSSSSFRIGYNRTLQYLHQISNTAVATPVDIWQISNRYLKPQQSDQYAIGFFKNFKDNGYEASAELYYKTAKNIPDYKEGSELLLNPVLEADLLAGIGKAYGLELQLKKNFGRWRGWVSYTYSRSLRKVAGDFSEETINRGKFYPAYFDKPHDLTIVSNYNIIKRVSFNMNFTYSTGRPVTAPSSQYVLGNVVVPNYSERNQYRIPDYHRLDISLRIEKTPRKATKIKSSLIIAVYNLYNRENAFSVFFRPNKYNIPQAYQLSIVGRAIFTISYNFEF
ncbi:MAG: TonB-dependent receptor [Microscillaceae bacterium]|nr:TonB-dependent receptor [Microscillaceae bacterium]